MQSSLRVKSDIDDTLELEGMYVHLSRTAVPQILMNIIQNSVHTVDGNHYILNVLKIMLEPNGFKCIEAESGVQAVETLSDQTIDLIITDLHMPDMSGFEFIDWVKENHPEIPITIVSAGINENLNEAQQASISKADAVIEKPFRAAELLDTIRPLT